MSSKEKLSDIAFYMFEMRLGSFYVMEFLSLGAKTSSLFCEVKVGVRGLFWRPPLQTSAGRVC